MVEKFNAVDAAYEQANLSIHLYIKRDPKKRRSELQTQIQVRTQTAKYRKRIKALENEVHRLRALESIPSEERREYEEEEFRREERRDERLRRSEAEYRERVRQREESEERRRREEGGTERVNRMTMRRLAAEPSESKFYAVSEGPPGPNYARRVARGRAYRDYHRRLAGSPNTTNPGSSRQTTKDRVANRLARAEDTLSKQSSL